MRNFSQNLFKSKKTAIFFNSFFPKWSFVESTNQTRNMTATALRKQLVATSFFVSFVHSSFHLSLVMNKMTNSVCNTEARLVYFSNNNVLCAVRARANVQLKNDDGGGPYIKMLQHNAKGEKNERIFCCSCAHTGAH